MKKLYILLTIILAFSLVALGANAKQLVVAVIDTGLGYNSMGADIKLCQTGHKDLSGAKRAIANFRLNLNIPLDHMGHGTHVAGTIDRYARMGHQDYCIVIIKYFDVKNKSIDYIDSSIKAIQYAVSIHADIINYSAGGGFENKKETALVKNYISKGGIFVAAAGNEGDNLATNPFYPAMSDARVIRVGNIDEDGKPAQTSNWGTQITCWEHGVDIVTYGIHLTGTSQATSIVTGRYIAGERSCIKK